MFCLLRPPATSTLLPYTTLFRSRPVRCSAVRTRVADRRQAGAAPRTGAVQTGCRRRWPAGWVETRQPVRSEEHTSELQSRGHIVCRLLLEIKQYYFNDGDVCILD